MIKIAHQGLSTFACCQTFAVRMLGILRPFIEVQIYQRDLYKGDKRLLFMPIARKQRKGPAET